MKNYTPLHCHSHYSLLDGLSQPKHIAARCKEIGVEACALTEHGSLSGSIQFIKALRNKDTETNIRPLLGVEFYVSGQDASIQNETNRKLSHLLLIAKNNEGWRNLIKITSSANFSHNFYYKPRLSLDQIAKLVDGNIIAISGHLGSDIANCLNGDSSNAHPLVDKLKGIFGKDNFFLETQLIYKDTVPQIVMLTEAVRALGRETDTKVVATPDAHYAWRHQAHDQRILLCRTLGNKTLADAQKDGMLSCFFQSDAFHIPSYDEMIECGHTEEELNNTNYVASLCGEYTNVLGKPQLPKFACPNNANSDEYLRELCRDGWRRKIQGVVSKDIEQVYLDRIKNELDIFLNAKLADYFLIVSDILKYVKNNHWLAGVGRGCLTESALVYMNNGGVKKIADIQRDDMVLSKDGTLHKVTNTFKYPCNEGLINITCNYGDNQGIILTKDHKIYAAKTIRISNHPKEKQFDDSKLHLEWISGEDLKKGDWVYFPRIQQTIHHTPTLVDLGIYSNNLNLTNDSNTCYYNIINGLTKRVNRIVSYNRFINEDEDFFFMLGLFTGDGWFIKDKKHLLGFAFNSENKILIQRMQIYFNKLGIHTTLRKHKTKKLIQLEVFGGHLVEHLKTLFNTYELTSKSKHVPELIFSLPYNLIQKYLDGYCAADGYIEKNRIKYTTVSSKLAYQIKYLYGILNIPCAVRHYKRKDSRGYPDWTEYDITIPFNHKTAYRFKECDGGILLRINKITDVNISDYVYDIEVDNEHNFLTTSYIVHNSAAGCLVSYLTDITEVDPIKYKLLLTRFYNSGRNTADHISLPDIDVDIPASKREQIINYIKEKYGHNKVAQLVTFQTMKGRGTLKDVIRAYGGISFDEMNQITEHIEDESKIADDLQHMKEETGEQSIIRWALENNADKLKRYCFINDNGELDGPLAKRFAQAIRLEGTKTAQSKHAAGIVIGPEPLGDICPMSYDTKTNSMIVAYEMNDAEAAGMVKLDILGLSLLDKLAGVQQIVAHGDFTDDVIINEERLVNE